MKSRVWRMAGVGLLCMSVNLPLLAEGQGASPLQSRPDEVRQTQAPRTGYYQDIPRRNDNRYYQAGGAGHPDGHGNGWGPGPQYRPGQTIERFPERYWKVPYRGHDYFYSGGYWYRPQGPRYVVVTPPYGVRVNYLPDYAREVWVGSALLFLAAGTYYQYLEDSREYVVVNPPTASAPQQLDRDRYECHRWAVQQTGFDPAAASYAPSAQVADNYRRAQGACLSGRGYSVN
ncbi:DUF6515 family protein [Pseudomonas donghuensis]|uniref:Glycine zipper family protein n=1 Tax=Pseudomonas donghuensis TaxID=1163398 RepID=A0AAP0SBQ5_9PSED|nr:DUF6515 family protein [Pseudomonas donghuensis]KDN97353.2 glycine zipper family protein [Pseudomonas donghuensis]MCP6692737.1 DUF6515 family protein [Pseudomonas donghuensis]MDF9895479.1 hypothetical protein [Pseudomonas vranovensis]WSE82791.1 DUF6515 family protein [Pseudomonas donghuensis]